MVATNLSDLGVPVNHRKIEVYDPSGPALDNPHALRLPLQRRASSLKHVPFQLVRDVKRVRPRPSLVREDGHLLP